MSSLKSPCTIRAGGSGCDGDLLLFPEEVGDIRRDSQATIWLDSGRGNIALGGNGHDGDLLIFPSDATISTTRTGDARLWLDGDSGDVRLAGGLKPMGSPERARALPEYSTNEIYRFYPRAVRNLYTGRDAVRTPGPQSGIRV